MCCTTPEFDDLKTELKAEGYDVECRFELIRTYQIRAELDAIIAHLYGLTESEFAHILKTFPIVKEEIKTAAMVEFKKLAGEK